MEKARTTSDLFACDQNGYLFLNNLKKQTFFLIAAFYFLPNNSERYLPLPLILKKI
jgi:hypothetical protein